MFVCGKSVGRWRISMPMFKFLFSVEKDILDM
jgi:hypothetical protein